VSRPLPVVRFYRALLRLYPASFRNEYGGEMTAVVRQRWRDADGPAARVMLALHIVQETVMNALAVHWDMLRQDLRYTARTLSRARGFALTAIVIVALGVGANTAAFSVTDFVLFRPLPFTDAGRLVTIWQRSPGYTRMELAPANILDWKRAATSFERLGIHKNYSASMTGAGEPERVNGAMISADLFPTLGVNASLGRIFAAGEDTESASKTVILSDRLWRAAFGGDPSVLGRKIVLDEEVYAVIGVMPPGFSFPNREAGIWLPLVMSPDDLRDRNNNEFYAVARLKPGATLESARAEMDVLAAQSRSLYPKENENTGVTVYDLRVDLSEEARVTVLALSGAALCVLLIVCANLANLLLARALNRRQELAVRTALGAGRERLIRQLATESVVLAVLGGAAGVLLATVLVPAIWRMVPADLPTSATPAVDLRVLAFAAVLTIVTAIAFGLAPMLHTGVDVHVRGLREGARAIGGHKERLRGALVIAEVIASVVLLVATGLLIRALWNVQGRDPGFQPEGVLTLRTDLASQYAVTSRRADYYNRVIEQLQALPGVTNAAYSSGLPMVWGGGIWPVGINGVEVERRDNNTASMRFVTPGFFATLRMPIRRGRDVSDSDTMTSQMVAVVSESFVKRHWPGQDPLGRQFNFASHDRTIVGIVGDVRVRGLERDSEPQVYLPHRQVRDGWLWGYTPKDLVVRAATPLDQLVPAVRSIIRAIDPLQPIINVRPMVDIVEAETAGRTVQVRVLAGFAGVAFLLAAIGIHGVLSFAVSQRTPEIGVRIALGAQRRDILAMVMRQGAVMVGAGLLPGLVLAYLAGRSLQTLLIGVTPGDVPTFAAATGLTLVMTVAGTLMPTLHALRVDPIKAIRAE
jgi:predicted permease